MYIRKVFIIVICLFSALDCYSQNWSKSDFQYILAGASGNVPSATKEEIVACQIELMYSYMNGVNGLPRDWERVAYWAEKAAINGDVSSQYVIAGCYEYGEGVPQDLTRALYWYERASMQNDHVSSLNAGKMYLWGQGTNVNYNKAASYFKNAAYGGVPEGKYYYALCFAQGYGVKYDLQKAVMWATRALDDKYYNACWLLGRIYSFGEIADRNISKALYYYELGINFGVAECANDLGVIYQNGLSGEKDVAKALEYYNIAARNGSVLGKANAAAIYLIKEPEFYNIHKAECMYKELVADGYYKYEQQLLDIYKYNSNYVGVFGIYKKWAINGNTSAMNSLAYMYVRGQGTSKSLKNALLVIDNAIKIEPDNLNYLDTKGDVYLIWGEIKKAEKIWRKIKKINPLFYNQPAKGYNASDLNAYFESIYKEKM